MESKVIDPAAPEQDSYKSPAYRWYALGVLALGYLCYGLDRALPGILVEPLRHEFGLKDAELGMMGMAYGLGFAVAVLPTGMLIDRMNRRNLLAVIIGLWSLCTALGGITRSYAQLLLARLGVGLTEAGATPTIIPMVSDIFPPERRSFVLGILFTSSHVGTMLAGALGGYLAAEYGWRAALMIVGFPGLLLALLIVATVREPRRGGSEHGQRPAVPAPSLPQVMAFLVRSPAVTCLILGTALSTMVTIVMGSWAGSFFIRVHGLELKHMGFLLGVAGLMTTLGPAISGWLADHLTPRHPDWTLRIVRISLSLGVAGAAVMLFAADAWVAIFAYLLTDLLRSGYGPLIYSVMTTNTPPEMRGTVLSISQLLSVVSGFVLGTVGTGMLSDYYGGGVAIRYALANIQLLQVVALVLLVMASRSLHRSRMLTGVA